MADARLSRVGWMRRTEIGIVIGWKVARHAWCHPEPREGSPRFFAKSTLSDVPRFFAEFTLSKANVLRMTVSEGLKNDREKQWTFMPMGLS